MRLLAILALIVIVGYLLLSSPKGSPGPSQREEGTVQRDRSSADGQELFRDAKDQGKTAVTQATEFAQSAMKELQPKFEQAARYVEEKRPEVAEGIVRELEKHRDAMPEGLKTRVDDLRRRVDSMKGNPRKAQEPTNLERQ